MEYTTEEMRENMKLWVAALRSGKYKQGCNQMKTPEGSYCCLGVLQEVMNFPNPNKYLLHPIVAEKVGLRGDGFGAFTDDPKEKAISHLNDSESKNFLELADIIEERFNKKFGEVK